MKRRQRNRAARGDRPKRLGRARAWVFTPNRALARRIYDEIGAMLERGADALAGGAP